MSLLLLTLLRVSGVISGGVKLTREKMSVVADQIRAFLTPKTKDNSDQSSLDHAVANGNVKVTQALPGKKAATFFQLERKLCMMVASVVSIASRSSIVFADSVGA